MKNLRALTYFFALSLFIMSCKNDDDIVVDETETETETEVDEVDEAQMFNFETLEVGQTFQFSLLFGELYYDNEEKELYEYTGDTLEIELLEIQGNIFTFSERILPTSAIFDSADDYYWMGRDSVYTNDWVIENDSLKIQAADGEFDIRSHLFFFGNFWERGVFIPLNDFNTESTAIEGWKTAEDFCECNMDLYTVNFSLFKTEYDRLNVAIRDEPMAGDGNGNTYLYSKNDGIVRSTHYSAWTGRGFGWDRIID